jgi:hypothetical protein
MSDAVSGTVLRGFIEHEELVGPNGTPAINTGTLASIVSELIARREADVWQPIETAPRGKVVLLWKPTTREQYVAALIDGGHGPGWCTPDGFEIFGATLWRPLPQPPLSTNEPKP